MEVNGCQNLLWGEQQYLSDRTSLQRSDHLGALGGWVRGASRHNGFPCVDDNGELYLFKSSDQFFQLYVIRKNGHLLMLDEWASVELTKSPHSLFQRISLTEGNGHLAGKVGDS